MLDIDAINDLCREIAEETLAERINEICDLIEDEELDNYMLAMGPRAYGPDAGADDSSGLFYWDLK